MSNPTTPFSWQMPTATDLVTDLPADFEVFGQAVATSLADLLGGTTGQVLSKTTNADMDFTWVAANPGDITGVTAGTGISGGGTSGTVTVTNDMATTITASGDIVVGTGSGTYDNLPIGTTGQILTADTTVSPYKVKWATPAGGGGKVLQVVSAENATNFSTTSTTPQATGLTVSITPTSATSKVLVLLSQAFQIYSSGNEANGLVSLLRDATIIADNVPNAYIGYRAIGATDVIGTCSYVVNYLDAPATTSSITYTTKIRVQTSATMTAYAQPSGLRSTIVLMEIGA